MWLSILSLFFVVVTFFITMYRNIYVRFHWTLKPIRIVSDFVWNVRNSKCNHGHWMQSNRFGGRCMRCGSQSMGGIGLTMLDQNGLLTCDNIIAYKAAQEVMDC
jgi:hypothetical protein